MDDDIGVDDEIDSVFHTYLQPARREVMQLRSDIFLPHTNMILSTLKKHSNGAYLVSTTSKAGG